MSFKNSLKPLCLTRVFAIAQGLTLGLVVVIPVPAAAAPPTLPTACSLTATCTTPTGKTITQFSGDASYAISGNQGVVKQTATKAIVNWKDFNIGAGNEVLFQRVDGQGNLINGASFSTLNRIWQGSPSEIAGKISVQAGQTGAIYLINQNGILFRKGAQIDVHTLVASALNIKDEVFMHPDGLYSAYDGKSKFDPAFFWEGSADDFRDTLIRIDPDVHLKTQLGGAMMFIAPKVVNRGTLETDRAQVVLAAGSRVYISAPPSFGKDIDQVPKDSPYLGLAGMLVEVDPFQGNDSKGAPVMAGQVINDTMGKIIAERGNVTLVALAVNQMGRVTATTSVTDKGSIRLLARAGNGCDKTNSGDCNETLLGQSILSAKTTGELILGDDSVTEVQLYKPPEGVAEKTLSDDQLFNPSTIQAVGKKILLGGRAQMLAPGGQITLSAQAKGNIFQLPEESANDSRVYLGEGAKIDVSGASATASVERYFIEVDLRGTELKDDPLNRYGFLRGKKVRVDLRELPDTAFADLSGYVNTIQRPVAEKLSAGGSVSLRSEGDLIMRAGSVVDVSGGVLNHSGGYGQTSKVVSNGVVFDLAQAKGDRVYDRILGQYTVTDPKWGVTKTYYLPTDRQYYAGYADGKDAGTMSYSANAYVFGGEFKGGVTVGPNQRQAAPQPGRLIIGDASQKDISGANFRSPDIVLRKYIDPLNGFASKDPLPQAFADQAQLSTDMLNRSGLANVAIYSNGKITLEAGSDLKLPAFGELALTAGKIDIRDSVIIPAGTISLTTQETRTTLGQADFDVVSGVTLSTAGVWVNDSLNGADLSFALAPRPHDEYDKDGNLLTPTSGKNIWDGGTVALQSAGALTLNTGSTLDVSGSGYVNSSGKLTAGNGGSIEIGNNKGTNYAPLTLNAALLGHALGKGGSLKLKAQALTLGNQLRGVAGEFLLRPEFFAANGFANYTLEGRDSVVVRSGADIAPSVASMVLDNGYTGRASGSGIRQFSKLELKPEYERQAANLTLNATSVDNTLPMVGGLTVEENATLRVEAGGALKLSATQNELKVQGSLIAPGGTIQLTMWPDRKDSLDLGYSQQAIWLGPKALISAAGAVITTPSNLRRGKVLDAGKIEIKANRGYVVAEQGAVLDVSGVAATFDLPAQVGPYLSVQPTVVAGNAGTIDISAKEGALLDPTIRAASSGARGGSLTLKLGPDSIEAGYPGSPTNKPDRQWKVVLNQKADVPTVPAGLKLSNIDDNAPGVMKFALDRALQGGVEQFAVKARDAVVFQGDVALQSTKGLRAITLDAPVIEGSGGKSVTLDAAYVNLGNTNPLRQMPQTAVAGAGNELLVKARHVDLTGNFALSGFDKASIQSDGDVRFVGVVPTVNPKQPVGSFTLANDLIIKARQIYASSFSSYAISAPGKTVTIAGAGKPVPVLSANSDLKIDANKILLEGLKPGEKGGTIKAPFGSVTLAATDTVTLGDGSLISVSGEGQTVPFGRTDQTGRVYVYDLGEENRAIDAPPEKHIVLQGKTVNFNEGATLDVSGGGDLLAYEWVKGLGGSKDVLSPVYSPNTYAVLPGYNNGFAPTDAQFQAELAAAKVSAPAAGSVVYLSGGSGLEANYYTLLPVRYGLLKGAYLVTVADAKYQDMLPNQSEARIAGGAIVSGYLAALNRDGGYTQTSRTQGFVVEPNAVAKSRSEYLLTTASDYFRGKGAYQLPGDAGRVVFNAQDSLSLIGQLVSKREAGYRGAEVDIAATKLAVVSPGGTSLTAAEKAEKYVELNADALNALGAESLLLGGTRSVRPDGDGVDVNVISEKMIVANAETATEKHALKGPEIILAATGQVLVKDEAVISGVGASVAHADTLHIANSEGDGALLRVSGGAQVSVLRNKASGLKGDLTIEKGTKGPNGEILTKGATVSGTGSLTFDATRNTVLDGNIDLGAGAGLALGAGLISLGDVTGVTEGLKYDLSAFGALLKTTDDLRLRSYKTIDIYGPLDMVAMLKGKAAPNLHLEAQGIKGAKNSTGQDPNVTLVGKQVYLSNPTGKAFTATTGTGAIEIQAQEIRTGDGDFAFSGFKQTTLSATSQIIADGKGSLKSTGDINLNAPRVTATNGSKYKFISSAALTVQALTSKAPALLQSVPGAALTFEGGDVTIGGMVDLPGGKITVTATTGDVTLNNGGELRAAGTEATIFDAAVGQPGGEIELNATKKVNLATGSVVDVSATGADAGALRISANSIVTEGDLKGGSTPGAEGATGNQGRFELDVGALAYKPVDLVDELGLLAKKLGAGSFNDSVRIRVRNGDITLAASKSVTAREIKLAADAGSIGIAGTLNATHARGGSIALAAKNDLTLIGDGVGGAKLHAEALDAGRQGGRVELAAIEGYLDLQSGSSIKVDGGTGGLGGQVWLRTGVDSNNAPKVRKDIQGNFNLNTSVSGATYTDASEKSYSATYLEVVQQKAYNQAKLDIDTALIGTLQSGLNTFYTNLTKPNSIFRVVPGLEIVNSGGDINLANHWNFGSVGTVTNSATTISTPAVRYGAQEAGVLTLRATGNVNLNKSLSDGFIDTSTKTSAVTPDKWVYDTSLTNTWGYRIVAGSDTAQAAPTAVKAGSGNVNIAAGQVVRTGAGFIDVAAGQDITFGLSGSGKTTQVGVLYTAGRNSPPLSDFNKPKSVAATPVIYPTGGGNIRLAALNNINGKYYKDDVSEPAVNQWLFRNYQPGQVNPQTTWWARFDKFRQGVATLGGGDIAVEAKGNIDSLWLSAPTNGRLGGDAAQAADIKNLKVQGGGDIVVRAGGNVTDGLIFLGQGQGKMVAGGKLESRVALQDATVQLVALDNVTVLDAFNPTAYTQSEINKKQSTNEADGRPVFFSSYGDKAANHDRYDAAIQVLSRSGNAALKSLYSDGSDRTRKANAYPGLVTAWAPLGDVSVDSQVTLFPNAIGDLNLIAGRNINLNDRLIMSDYAVKDTHGIAGPTGNIDKMPNFVPNAVPDAAQHDPQILHLNDTKLAHIYAGQDVIGTQGASLPLLNLAKPAVVQAGRDVQDLWAAFQNVSPGDVSQVLAGRDVRFQTNFDAKGLILATNALLEVGGPGRLEVIAGRDIDLGASGGIVSVGDAINPYLGNAGASLTVLAGMGTQGSGVRQPDYAAFKLKYLDPQIDKTTGKSVPTQAIQDFEAALKLLARKQVRAQLKYEAETKLSPLSDSALEQLLNTTEANKVTQRANDLLSAFYAQSSLAQARLVFFNELREAGKEWSESGKADRGVKAASVLFPTKVNGQPVTYAGDLNLFFSQIKTERGGDIELFVPGGLLNVGLASSGAQQKTAAELGIVTIREGEVRAYVRDDIQVNSSRIFTLGGNDIVLWSDLANIDAGKGSKTARAAPPPKLVVKDGKVFYDLSGSVSGSGIATQDTLPGLPPGDTILIAPNGEVNAGDAGIRSGGNLLIAAQRVVGADNIQVGGISTGVPATSTGSNLGALAGSNSLPTTPDQTQSLNNAAGDQGKRLKDAIDKLANFGPSFITVEVAGFGETGASNPDECRGKDGSLDAACVSSKKGRI